MWLEEKLKASSPPFLITGAGSQTVANWFPGDKLKIVPELEATGLGGAYLAQQERCIVINIGSGTPILYTDSSKKEVVHVTGTGLGSASLAGLSFYMTGIEELDLIEHNAEKGNPDRVNLLIKDIYKNPELIDLPGDATASNFGKYQDWRHLSKEERPNQADLLAGLHCMIGETLAVIASSAAHRFRDQNLTVVVTGGGTLNTALLKYLEPSFEFLGTPYTIPKNAVYSTLWGLFVSEGLI
jgi:pantothenate kinase